MDKLEQAKQIAEGLTNFLKMKAHISDPEIEDIQRKRFAVCLACEFRKAEKNTCSLCGCLLELKTRALAASCPKAYWKEIIKER